MESAPRLDHSPINVEIALQRLNGSTAILSAMVGFFLEDAPPLLGSLQDAVRDGALNQVVRTAHNLRGLAAPFEALAVMQIAQQIEDRARADQPSGLEELVGNLNIELARLYQALRQLQV